MNKEQVLRQVYEAFGAGDMERLAELFAEDVVVHVPPGLPISGDYNSRDEFFSGMLGKVVDTLGGPPQLEVLDILASEDHAVGLLHIRAQRDGTSYEWRHVNVYHIRDGQVTEFWWTPFDQEAVRRALN